MIDQVSAVRHSPPRLAIAAIIMIVVLGVWQAATEIGVFPILGVWEETYFGGNFPAVDVAILVMVPLLLVLLLVAYRRGPKVGVGDVSRVALLRGERVLRTLAICVAITIMAAIGILVAAAMVPGDIANRPRVDAYGNIVPKNQAATVVGPLIPGKAVRFERRIAGIGRSYEFAMVAPGPRDSGMIRYFVQIPRIDAATQSLDHSGIVMRNGLPLGAKAVFEAAGYRVAPTHAVVFSDAANARWPYYAVAAQVLALAALLMIAATLQWYTVRGIRKASVVEPVPDSQA